MTSRVTTITKGPPGPPGPPGPAGPPGTPSSQETTFASAAATWTVSHSFNRDPVVTVLVGSGPGGALQEWETDVDYSPGQVVVTFASPHTGKVVLT